MEGMLPNGKATCTEARWTKIFREICLLTNPIKIPLAFGLSAQQVRKLVSKLYTPSSGFVSPPVPNVVVTPSIFHPMPTFTSPTQQAAGVSFNMDFIPCGGEQLLQEKPYSDFIDLNVHSMINDDDIQSIDWDAKSVVNIYIIFMKLFVFYL